MTPDPRDPEAPSARPEARPRARLVPEESKAPGERLPADPDGKVWIADETPDPPPPDIRDDADDPSAA